jgi:hypothetical protein
MLVYLATPYSDSDPAVVEQRVANFCKMSAHLIQTGIFTISPILNHLILGYAPLPNTWEYWKNFSETLLQKCDKMIVLQMDGWDTSTGVIAELELCDKYNIPVEYISNIDIQTIKNHYNT